MMLSDLKNLVDKAIQSASPNATVEFWNVDSKAKSWWAKELYVKEVGQSGVLGHLTFTLTKQLKTTTEEEKL